MPQLPGDIVKARAAQLRHAGDRRLALRLDRHVGTIQTALMESGGRARLPDFAPVRLDALARPGTLVQVELTDRTDEELIGRLI